MPDRAHSQTYATGWHAPTVNAEGRKAYILVLVLTHGSASRVGTILVLWYYDADLSQWGEEAFGSLVFAVPFG